MTAAPNRMQLDPGDGSAVLTCDFTTGRSDDCRHIYRRASGDGEYAARIRLIWDVTFTDGGDVIEIDGLPTSFSSQWEPASIPVREVQSLVVPG